MNPTESQWSRNNQCLHGYWVTTYMHIHIFLNTVKLLYFVNQWLNSILQKQFSWKLHGEVGAGRGSIAVIPLQLSISTLPNMWSPSAWVRIDMRWRKKRFISLQRTSMLTSSHIYDTTVLSCVLLNQARHFANSWRNLPTEYDLREDRLDLGVDRELSKYSYSTICVWITKYTDHTTLTQFFVETNFVYGGYFAKSAKCTAHEI